MTSNALVCPGLCGMCGVLCGTLCGVKSLINKACAVCAVSRLTGAGGRVCAKPDFQHTRTHTQKPIGIPHIPHIPHTPYVARTYVQPHTAHVAAHTAHSFFQEKR